ncbi:hypothetical protein EJA72_15980 [Pseudomonas sp. PB120]|nr:hypothetical protein [Pseudomonas sp. PB120]
MNANDDAGCLNARVVRASIASRLAPTGNCVACPFGLIRRRHPGCLVVLVVIAVFRFREARMRKSPSANLTGQSMFGVLSQRFLRSAARRRQASPNAWKILK